MATVEAAGGEVIFIELVCPLDEIKRRLTDPARNLHGKLTSVNLFEQLQAEGSFDALPMPPAGLSIDTSLYSPGEVAAQIAHYLRHTHSIPNLPHAQAS